ncbi:MAG: polysaccharide deacetylase family protein [Bacteroidota bacterium]
MLYVLSTFDSPRLRYALDLVLQQMLGLEWTLVMAADYEPEKHAPLVNYTQLMLEEAIDLPNSGLLSKDVVEEVDLKVSQQGGKSWLFFYPVSGRSYQLPYDVFSAVFYLATEYEKYVWGHKDQYDRDDHSAYPSQEYGLNEWPLAHVYAFQLGEVLQQTFNLRPQPPIPQDEITIDVDFPWKYKHKGLVVELGGLVKDVVKGGWHRLGERFTALFRGKDPNYTFPLIQACCSPDKTRFFFLIDRNSPHDSRFTHHHPEYRALIQSLAEAGYGLGIHPSFTSYLDEKRLQTETEALKKLVKKDILHSRQHFLRLKLPDTYRYLLDIGIKAEYSPCRFQDGGFPAGMCMPYPWFDLAKNEATELMLHPTIAMDRTFQQYLGLHATESVEAFRILRQRTHQFGGTFTFLFHNDALSESEEWIGWREPLVTFLGEING